jgi:ATP-dependent DNA helicase RecG
MMSSHERRTAALEALDQVKRGVTADAAETEVVDFKEENGTVGAGGVRQSIGARHEPAAVALAAEVACLANSSSGGVLVVGVDDKAAGESAFVGTYLDTEWLRGRIYALTQPGYTVELEELTFAGARLYLVNVPPALEEVRAAGWLRTRVGKACVELTGDRARKFLERRRSYDWSAEPSGRRLHEITPAALASAREKYQAARGTAPESALELCRRMNVLITSDDSPDPELNHAGALLLTGFEPEVEQFVVLVTAVEGVPSSSSVRGPAPLLELFDQAWDVITTDAFPAKTTIFGPSRRLVRAIPDLALREALVNAIMHRDYRLPGRAVTALATSGDTFKVRSPGGFVTGVRADRLITSPSVARNPALAWALRTIGLGEREGVGIDTMYAQMLRAGHRRPDISEDGGDVVVTLHGGAPDLALASFFEQLARRDPGLDDVRTAMAVTALLEVSPLRAEALAVEAQCTVDEGLDTLTRLERAGVVVRLVNRSRAFRLSEATRTTFGSRIHYPTRRKLEEHQELVRAFLDAAPEIGREDVAELIGVAPNYASRILGDLAREGWLLPVANARGAGVRYRLADGTRPTGGPPST